MTPPRPDLSRLLRARLRPAAPAAMLIWMLAVALPAGAQQPAPAAAPRAQAAPTAGPAASKPAPRGGGAIEGVINRVTDGDSLWLQPAGRAPIEVRLRDVDAPEICQDYGPEAKRELERFVLGKTAQLVSRGKDGFGRTVGEVTIDGQSVSKWMVGEGHAWSTRYRSDRGPLLKEERMATALRRGLHATSEPQKPWDFRKAKGSCK